MIAARTRLQRSRRAALALALGGAWQGCILDTDIGHWAAPEADADAAQLEPQRDGSDDAGCTSTADAAACAQDAGASSGEVLTVTPGFTTSYFADGRSFPAGEYTLVYVDGCWTSGIVAWTVNLGEEGYWVVGGEPEQRIVRAPGSEGTFAGGLGAYGSYQECVAANVGRSGITFRFEGGPLGLELEELDPLMSRSILLRGGESEGGRSPTFRLTCTGSCR